MPDVDQKRERHQLFAWSYGCKCSFVLEARTKIFEMALLLPPRVSGAISYSRPTCTPFLLPPLLCGMILCTQYGVFVAKKATYAERWQALANLLAMSVKKVAFNAQVEL